MIEESKTAKGRAIATLDAEAYIITSAMVYHSKPFPIKSSIYLKRKNINRINITIKNVTINGLTKALMSNRCIFLNIQIYVKVD